MTIPSNVRSSRTTSLTFAPLAMIESGTPRPSVSTLRLRPFFPPIRWVGTNAFLSQWRFAKRTINALPLPSNAFHLVVLSQPGLPEPGEESLLLPLLKMFVNGAGAAKFFGHGFPLTAGAQDINDGGEDLA